MFLCYLTIPPLPSPWPLSSILPFQQHAPRPVISDQNTEEKYRRHTAIQTWTSTFDSTFSNNIRSVASKSSKRHANFVGVLVWFHQTRTLTSRLAIFLDSFASAFFSAWMWNHHSVIDEERETRQLGLASWRRERESRKGSEGARKRKGEVEKERNGEMGKWRERRWKGDRQIRGEDK